MSSNFLSGCDDRLIISQVHFRSRDVLVLIIEFVAGRSGSVVFALRHYEPEGLIIVGRNAGEQSRLERADIRRLSFIRIVQLSRSSLLKVKCNLMSCLRRAPKKLDLVGPVVDFGRISTPVSLPWKISLTGLTVVLAAAV